MDIMMILLLLLCVDSSLGSSGLVSFFLSFFYIPQLLLLFYYPFVKCMKLTWVDDHHVLLSYSAGPTDSSISSSTASSQHCFARVQYSVYTLYTHNIISLVGCGSGLAWLLSAFIFIISQKASQVIRLFFSPYFIITISREARATTGAHLLNNWLKGEIPHTHITNKRMCTVRRRVYAHFLAKI